MIHCVWCTEPIESLSGSELHASRYSTGMEWNTSVGGIQVTQSQLLKVTYKTIYFISNYQKIKSHGCTKTKISTQTFSVYPTNNVKKININSNTPEWKLDHSVIPVVRSWRNWIKILIPTKRHKENAYRDLCIPHRFSLWIPWLPSWSPMIKLWHLHPPYYNVLARV